MERNETLMQYFEWYLPADCGQPYPKEGVRALFP